MFHIHKWGPWFVVSGTFYQARRCMDVACNKLKVKLI